MVDLAKLKARSGKASLEKLTQELAKFDQKQFGGDDERFWKPTVDKAGNGYAVLRFLDAHDDDDERTFVRLYDHGFQGPTGSWYFENSLTTLGKPDPVSEHNTKLWNSGLDADKELARKYKRRVHFIVRIYVITDQGAPDNEGKVFYWKMGKQLFDKVKEAMNPEFEDETPVNPFHLWEGANFKLKIRKVDGYRNYEKSEFAAPAPLGKDEEIVSIMTQAENFPLHTFLAPDQFKSYEELKAKFEKVMNGNDAPRTAVDRDETPSAPAPKGKTAEPHLPEEEDDETAEWFKNLAEED